MSRKLALLIGINYTRTAYALAGCINDALNVGKILGVMGYDCTYLLDDGTCRPPTRNNILAACKQLVSNAKRGDSLFFHYSGHGTHTIDRDGDEDDGRDEAICPLSGGNITDDELRHVLTDRLPIGSNLFMLLDCCHSGTGADLRYNYDNTAKYNGGGRTPVEFDATHWTCNAARRLNARRLDTKTAVVCISGCRDNQTSADTVFDDQACGAMTAAFLKAWEKHATADNRVDVLLLCNYMTGMLKCYGYGQIPQLSLGTREQDALMTKNALNLVL